MVNRSLSTASVLQGLWLTGLYQLLLFSEDLVTWGNPFIRLYYELH